MGKTLSRSVSAAGSGLKYEFARDRVVAVYTGPEALLGTLPGRIELAREFLEPVGLYGKDVSTP